MLIENMGHTVRVINRDSILDFFLSDKTNTNCMILIARQRFFRKVRFSARKPLYQSHVIPFYYESAELNFYFVTKSCESVLIVNELDSRIVHLYQHRRNPF